MEHYRTAFNNVIRGWGDSTRTQGGWGDSTRTQGGWGDSTRTQGGWGNSILEHREAGVIVY